MLVTNRWNIYPSEVYVSPFYSYSGRFYKRKYRSIGNKKLQYL